MTDEDLVPKSDSVKAQLRAFIKAHHDGDTDSAIMQLLFCHKYMTALEVKRAKEELERLERQLKQG